MLAPMERRIPLPIAVVLGVSYLAALVLLGKLTSDLGELDPLFTYPAWGVFLFAFGIAGANVLRAWRGGPAREVPRWARAALVLAIPTAFVASVLDCMGLSFLGCTDLCNVFARVGTPALALLAFVHYFTADRVTLGLLTTLPLVFLYPNCLCRNPINRDWIDWLGQSPACFGSAFGASLIALAALHGGALVRLSVVATWTIVVGMLAFFVGHHYYDYPW